MTAPAFDPAEWAAWAREQGIDPAAVRANGKLCLIQKPLHRACTEEDRRRFDELHQPRNERALCDYLLTECGCVGEIYVDSEEGDEAPGA